MLHSLLIKKKHKLKRFFLINQKLNRTMKNQVKIINLNRNMIILLVKYSLHIKNNLLKKI